MSSLAIAKCAAASATVHDAPGMAMSAVGSPLAAVAGSDTPVEARYRLAGPCVTSSCGFWTGDHCGLGARMAASYQETVGPAEIELPKCDSA